MFPSGYSSSWFNQIGLTAAVETQANQGAGITLALVDTGVVASNPEIAGRVSPLSSCAALTFTCSSGYNDDNGHGTATASIAGGQLNASDLMSGVAPAVTILSEKVLDASGSGYDTDVANGITLAAKNGASVISLSLTYIPTQAIVTAINYATALGAVIVWAGGNSSAPLNGGADSTGLSPAALTHLIIVGSVDSNNVLSSFSNTPGPGSEVSSSSSVSYASIWLMAPGENIVAPAPQYGNGVYGYWTGTSMSTPEVAGAVALLEAAWPILKTNGTAPAVLFSSATNLGPAQTYGNGLLNIAKAFQPIGPLGVATGAGSVGITASTSAGGGGGIAVGGAFGALPFVAAKLSHYTAFDSFERNFTVNLSGLIGGPSQAPTPQVSYAPPLASDAIQTSTGRLMLTGISRPSFAQGVFGDGGSWEAGDPFATERAQQPAMLAFAGAHGEFVAMGHGVSPSLSFAQAAWGAESLAAQQDDALGVSTSLVNLAQGGYFGAIGAEVLGPVRIAASWSSTPTPVGSALFGDQTRSRASAAAIAMTARLGGRWTLGLTYSSLQEDNALLGSTYGTASLLNLGDHRGSQLLGLAASLDLGGRRSLMAEASTAETGGGAVRTGLISSVTPLRSLAWGASFIQGGALRRGDSLSISLRQPLRVVSGSAELAETTVDSFGFPVTTYAPVSLAPTGHETDAILGYSAPVSRWASFRSEVSYRSDADNTAGLNDVAFRFGMSVAF